MAETLPGYAAEVWYGMFVPKATPSAIVERLSAALRKAADLPAYKAALQKDGLTSSVNSPAEMAAFMATEVARWRKVVVEAKVTTD